MMYGGKRSVKNRRVNNYTITLNPHFDSFAISPAFLYEKALKFVYELNGETIEKVVPIGEDMIEFYPYDGGVIKQEWHSTARQRGWNEERKRTTTEKRLKTLEARKNAKEC